MSTLKFKNLVLKICYSSDWNEEDGHFGKGFLQKYINTYRFSANILKVVLKNCRREFLKILGGVIKK